MLRHVMPMFEHLSALRARHVWYLSTLVPQMPIEGTLLTVHLAAVTRVLLRAHGERVRVCEAVGRVPRIIRVK